MLYFCVGWITRKVAPLYNMDNENAVNETPFLRDVAIEDTYVSTNWALLIGIYFGGTLLYGFSSYVYDLGDHSWNTEIDNNEGYGKNRN